MKIKNWEECKEEWVELSKKFSADKLWQEYESLRNKFWSLSEKEKDSPKGISLWRKMGLFLEAYRLKTEA